MAFIVVFFITAKGKKLRLEEKEGASVSDLEVPSDQAEALAVAFQIRKMENWGKGDSLLTPTGFLSALAACVRPDREHCTHTGG